MDIDAAVERLVDALETSDNAEAANAAENIVLWMHKGGFAPKLEFHTVEFLMSKLADLLRR